LVTTNDTEKRPRGRPRIHPPGKRVRKVRQPQGDPLIVDLDAARGKLGGLGLSTIYELIAQGRLTKVKIGARTFVTMESVTRLIEDGIAAAKGR
jgi:hypothetical protein